MKRYVEGEARSQTTLFPDTLDDYIAEDNPVRVVDVFVDELDLKKLGFDGDGTGGDWAACISAGDSAQDLCLRIPEPHTLEPASGAGVPTQRRVDLAHNSTGTRFQDHRGFP